MGSYMGFCKCLQFQRSKNGYITHYAPTIRLENKQNSCAIRVFSFLDITLSQPLESLRSFVTVKNLVVIFFVKTHNFI